MSPRDKGANRGMKYKLLLILIIGLSCEPPKKDLKKSTGKNDGLVKSYSKDGKLLSEINYKDGVRDGIGKSYYKNGNIQLYIPYVMGKRHGVVKRYYESGKIYKETEFSDDRETGTQKTYKENGKLRSEARLEDGEPCIGLKEYLLDGTVKKKYPTIVSKVVDKVRVSGEYFVYLSLSDGYGRVKFYRGELSKTGCLTNRLVPLPFNQKSKQGELKYTIPVGGFLMEEVNIVAEITTLAGNSYLMTKKLNVAIDN